MESLLFLTDLLTAHEPELRKPLEINKTIFRFMGSLHFFFETHWGHEPGRVAFVRAPRSVTAQYFDVPVYGLLVGKIGSG